MNRQKGFTIVELMVAVGVVSILAAVAVPSYRFLITTNQLSAQSNRLLGSLLYARSEAVKRGQSVSVCWSATGTACGGASGQGWSDGWMVFADVAADGTYQAADDTILKVGDATPGGHKIKSSFTNYVLLQADGSARAAGGFTLCSSGNESQHTRKIDVARTGRPRVSKEGTCP